MGTWGVVCTTAAFVVVATEKVVIYLLRVVSMQERRTRESRKGRKKGGAQGPGHSRCSSANLLCAQGALLLCLAQTPPPARPHR